MHDLVFIDTETTGIDLLVDRLFQVAYKFRGKMYSEYFSPPVPISIKAQSITHITNEMVEGKEEFNNSSMKKALSDILKSNILVAHNAIFDIDMLAKEGVETTRFICTLKVARFLDTEGIIPEYNMQYLRYYLALDVKAGAHEASDDVLVLEALFKNFYTQMLQEYGSEEKVLNKMVEVSSLPSLFKIFPFGKHKGKRIEEVVVYDRPYIEWILEQKIQNEYYDEDWIYTLKYHLNIQ